MAAFVYRAGPGRGENRRLALLFLVEGTSVGMCTGLIMFMGEAAEAYVVRFVTVARLLSCSFRWSTCGSSARSTHPSCGRTSRRGAGPSSACSRSPPSPSSSSSRPASWANRGCGRRGPRVPARRRRRWAARRPAHARRRRHGGVAGRPKRDVFRASFERALRSDETLTKRERAMLDAFREQLGLTPTEAGAIEREVQAAARPA